MRHAGVELMIPKKKHQSWVLFRENDMYWFGAVKMLVCLKSPGNDPCQDGENAVLVEWMKSVTSQNNIDWDVNLIMPVLKKLSATEVSRLVGPPQGNLINVSDLICVPVVVVPHPRYSEDSTVDVYVGYNVRDSNFFYSDVPNPNNYSHAVIPPVNIRQTSASRGTGRRQ
jgi:hypothetical protein